MQNQLQTETTPIELHRPKYQSVRKAIGKRSFATLATTSTAGRPHVAGVLFEAIGDALYVNTLRSSRKARNVAANPHVAICVPIRRLPVGPPSTVMFQTTGDVVDLDDPAITDLVEQGLLKSITGHGELELADGCFLRIAVNRRLLTYGLGMPIRKLIADPLSAGGVAELEVSR